MNQDKDKVEEKIDAETIAVLTPAECAAIEGLAKPDLAYSEDDIEGMIDV